MRIPLPFGGNARNRLLLMDDYRRGRASVRGAPMSLILETTVRCNLECPMCLRRVREHPPEDMTPEVFRAAIDSCRTPPELVFLFGMGEPLLNPHLPWMIDYCSSRGISTVLSTNATLLDEKRRSELLGSGLDYIIFGMDGATAQTYEKLRAGARFDAVRSNIESFLEEKKRTSSKMFTVVQLVRLKENEGEIKAFREYWSGRGAGEIRIKEEELGVEGMTTRGPRGSRGSRTPCHFLWQGPLLVRWDGRVFPCCNTFDSRPLGLAGERTMEEFWNDSRVQSLRKANAEGRAGEIAECARCRAPAPSKQLAASSFIFDSLDTRKLVPALEKAALFLGLPLFGR